MFTLCLEKGKYVRVRRGVERRDIERVFGFPVNAEIFTGAIIPVIPKPKGYCYALPHDSYLSIAKREGVSVEKLEKLNASSPVYPSKKIWLP